MPGLNDRKTAKNKWLQRRRATIATRWLVLPALLALAHCQVEPEVAGALDDPMADDGGFSADFVLAPGRSHGFSVHCNEWFSCDGTVVVAISVRDEQHFLSAAIDAAEADYDGSGRDETIDFAPVYQVAIARRGEEPEVYEVLAKTAVTVDNGRAVAWRQTVFTTELGDYIDTSATTSYSFESDDADQVFDVTVTNIATERTLSLGVAAEWQ